ncbi:MAG: thermonuclease family protein [Nanoarchaeota archaeon]|nr:thermonuclease family protein [Nanoarchaeota archaeon]
MNIKRRRELRILILFVTLFLVINYPYLDRNLEEFLMGQNTQEVFVDRVIDGDTIVSNGTSIRLLGINSPERGELFYGEAKSYLESLVLNKSVMLEFVGERQDKYFRTLAYVFLEGENVNLRLVEEGFANYYFYSGRDKYADELEEAWVSCLDEGVNLCGSSTDICGGCIVVNGNKIVNRCSFSCNLDDWVIKGEGRDKIVLNGSLGSGGEKMFELDLSDSGGSLFLRDGDGGLVWFKAD